MTLRKTEGMVAKVATEKQYGRTIEGVENIWALK